MNGLNDWKNFIKLNGAIAALVDCSQVYNLTE